MRKGRYTQRPEGGLQRSVRHRRAAQSCRGSDPCRKAATIHTATERPKPAAEQPKPATEPAVATEPKDATGRPKDAAAGPDRRREIRRGRQGRNAETPGCIDTRARQIRNASARHLLARRRFVTSSSCPAKAVCLAQTA